jgi:hypothetical protein
MPLVSRVRVRFDLFCGRRQSTSTSWYRPSCGTHNQIFLLLILEVLEFKLWRRVCSLHCSQSLILIALNTTTLQCLIRDWSSYIPGRWVPLLAPLTTCRSDKSVSLRPLVSVSWCREYSGSHDQMFVTIWRLLYCLREPPTLTRDRVCQL